MNGALPPSESHRWSSVPPEHTLLHHANYLCERAKQKATEDTVTSHSHTERSSVYIWFGDRQKESIREENQIIKILKKPNNTFLQDEHMGNYIYKYNAQTVGKQALTSSRSCRAVNALHNFPITSVNLPSETAIRQLRSNNATTINNIRHEKLHTSWESPASREERVGADSLKRMESKATRAREKSTNKCEETDFEPF